MQQPLEASFCTDRTEDQMTGLKPQNSILFEDYSLEAYLFSERRQIVAGTFLAIATRAQITASPPSKHSRRQRGGREEECDGGESDWRQLPLQQSNEENSEGGMIAKYFVFVGLGMRTREEKLASWMH